MHSEIITPGLSYLHREWRHISGDTLLVVTDAKVRELYHSKLGLEEVAEKKVFTFEVPRGEAAKTKHTYCAALDFFLKQRIHPRTHLVAVGGGALSDVAGLVAATLLRGLDWSVVPTTLLSMVDASIGGKVGINWGGAKNQVGSIHFPRHIFLCPEFLASLSDDEWSSGVGEVVKYGFLSAHICHLLEKGRPLGEIILACADYKQGLVAAKDRQALNLGHTFGHALEKLYCLPHGEAVYWGMALIFSLYGGRDFLPLLKEWAQKLWPSPRWKAPAPWCAEGFPTDAVFELILKDKKAVSREAIELVLVAEPGHPTTEVVTFYQLEKRLREHRELLENFSL